MILKNIKTIFLMQFLIVILLIFNINFLSADPPTCAIMPRQDCLYNGHPLIMLISNYSNAHVSITTQPDFPGTLAVCCGGLEEYIGLPNNCVSNLEYKILGISNTSNAHVERKDFSNYTNSICYPGFENVIASTSHPGGDFFRVVSISNTSNAHVSVHSNSGIHPPYQRIVYSEWEEDPQPPIGDECILIDAYWMVPAPSAEGMGTQYVKVNEENNHVISGTDVRLRIQGNTYCNANLFNLIIKRHPGNQPHPEGEDLQGTFVGSILNKDWRAVMIPEGITDGTPQRFFFNGTQVLGGTSGTVSIGSGLLSSELLYVYPPTEPNYLIERCFDYNWYIQPPLPPAYPLNPRNEDPCNYDIKRVAWASASPGVNCAEEDVSCKCNWEGINEGQGCKFVWSQSWGEIEAGSCVVNYELTNSCDEPPFDTYSYTTTGIWTWNPECNEECQANNIHHLINCQTPSSQIGECATEIPLSFFTFYNFLVAILLILGIYFVLKLNKSKKSKKDKK